MRTFARTLPLCLLLFSSVARAAEPSATDRAAAEALFRAAKDLQTHGQLTEACAKYMESFTLDPKPGALLNVAACHEEEGKTASAWAEFADAATLAAKFKQTARETYARDRARSIEARLARVTFAMAAPPEGLEIKVDGHAMGAAILGASLPLDPGAHDVRASAPGHAPWVQSITVEKGPSEQTVTVPALVALPEAVVATPAAAQPPKELPIAAPLPVLATAPVAADSTNKTNAWIPYVTLGVAAAGLGAGTAFGIVAIDRSHDADQHCNGARCDREGVAANDAARSAATGSTIGFTIGAVGALATALVLFVPPIQKRLRVGFGAGSFSIGGAL